MKQESEAKFLRIDLEKIRATLISVDAKLETPMIMVKRAILETAEMRSRDAFVRVRDEGNGITATYKQHASLSFGGASEIEIIVDDFSMAVELFQATGLTYKSYQESKRETWLLDDTIITLDVWPWLDPLIEVESESRESVREVARTLGFDWDDAVFGGVMIAYQHQYPRLDPQASIIDLAEVKFDSPLPAMFQ